jgi:polyisoprenoid-binding protein YceI
MRRQGFVPVLIALIALIPGLAGAATWEIDTAHSSVGFVVRHLGISKVNGAFGDFSGTLVFDEGNLEGGSATVTIKTTSIDTQNPKRDEHLRSADFFDTAKYPEIAFTSTSVVKSGEGYLLNGRLKIVGTERNVQIPFTFLGSAKDPWGGTRAGFEGKVTLKREELGVGWSNPQFRPPLIGNEVEILLNLEVAQKG